MMSGKTAIFAELASYIDQKLENTLLPSLSLVFRDFDPVNNELTIVISVNTLAQDQEELLQKNILNPHVYVVSKMINLLRQSKFILSEDIVLHQLDIQRDVLYVGSNEVPVSNTTMEFTLPLQKSTQSVLPVAVAENSENSSLVRWYQNSIPFVSTKQ